MPSLAEQAQTIADLYQPPVTGRPSDIGDTYTVKELLEAIEQGNYLETACHLAGLSHVTILNWKKRGDAGEAPFDRFVTALKQAEARAEAKMVANVRKASELPQFWAAAATHLERRHPDRWGKRQDDQQVPRVVVQIGVGQGEVKVGVQLSPPTFAPDSLLVDTANLLTDKACALSSSPITAIMVTNAEARQALSSAPIEAHLGQTEGQGESAISCRRTPKGTLPGGSVAARQRRLSRHKARLAQKEKKAKVATKQAQEGA